MPIKKNRPKTKKEKKPYYIEPKVFRESLQKYYDTDNVEYTLDSSKYFVDADSTPARISLNYGESWPSVTLRPIKGLVINYDAGYGTASDVPDRIKDAIYLYCAYRYENRIAEDGTVPPAFYNILQPDRIEDR